jgi:hypothetical protein
MSSFTSLHPVETRRVSVADAERVYSQSRILGDPMACSNIAKGVHTDVYNRPVHMDTLNLSDAACSHYNSPARRRIAQETTHRPMIGPYRIGDRGSTDTWPGLARDATPHNIYGRPVPFQNEFGHNLKRKDGPMYPQYISEASRFRKPKTKLEDALEVPLGN